jgi:hypothetical protein
MLRILSFAAATAAMLVIPFTEADARRGPGGGMGVSHSMGARSFSGARVGSFSTIKSVHVGPRRVAFIGPHFRHRRHFFGGFYAVGLYDSCWRWVPTVYGLRRVWVCDPYPYY